MFFMINLQFKFHFSKCNLYEGNEWKLQIIGIFLSPRALSVKTCSIISKIELVLDIHKINLHTKFHSSRCNFSEENEQKLQSLQKLQIIGIFRSLRGISQILLNCTQIKTWPSLMDYSYSYNLYTKFHFSRCNLCGENEQKLMMD